jgi:hypothetical protein
MLRHHGVLKGSGSGLRSSASAARFSAVPLEMQWRAASAKPARAAARLVLKRLAGRGRHRSRSLVWRARGARRADSPVCAPDHALRVRRCSRGSARHADRPRHREHAHGGGELGLRLHAPVARVDHPRHRDSGMAPGDRDEHRLPISNATPALRARDHLPLAAHGRQATTRVASRRLSHRPSTRRDPAAKKSLHAAGCQRTAPPFPGPRALRGGRRRRLVLPASLPYARGTAAVCRCSGSPRRQRALNEGSGGVTKGQRAEICRAQPSARG